MQRWQKSGKPFSPHRQQRTSTVTFLVMNLYGDESPSFSNAPFVLCWRVIRFIANVSFFLLLASCLFLLPMRRFSYCQRVVFSIASASPACRWRVVGASLASLPATNLRILFIVRVQAEAGTKLRARPLPLKIFYRFLYKKLSYFF